MTTFTATLQSFFTVYLMDKKQPVATRCPRTVTPPTAAAPHPRYQWHDPDAVEFTDVNAEIITALRTYLETIRHNTIRSRNARLGSLQALFAYGLPPSRTCRNHCPGTGD